MTPTTAATPAPASNATMPGTAATAAAPEAAPTDFLLMLGQLAASAPEATTVAAAVVAGSAVQETEGEETESDGAAASALAMFSLPMPAPTAPAPVGAVKEGAADMIAELQLARQKPAESVVPLLPQDAAFEEIANTQSAEGVDAPTAFDNALALHSPEKLAHGPRAVVTDHARAVHTPVGSSTWADEIGSRVTMMAKQGEQTASLRLSPEHLGPLEIRVAIRDDQASVWFGAAHADTRAAIENALPRLREMFEAQGMSLTDAGVFRESPRGQASQAATTVRGAEDAQLEAQPTTTRAVLGLVDAYA